VICSDEYQFIFYAVPKTGSRSMQNFLQRYGRRSVTGWSPNHNNYEEVKSDVGIEKSNKYFKFAFFRNPWAMLVSMYFYNMHIWGLNAKKDSVVNWLNTYKGGDPYIPYIFDNEGNAILDFMGKLENSREDLKTVCKMLKIPISGELSHIGKQHVKGRLDYRAYYESPVLVEKIRKIFSKSLSVLNYDFNEGV